MTGTSSGGMTASSSGSTGGMTTTGSGGTTASSSGGTGGMTTTATASSSSASSTGGTTGSSASSASSSSGAMGCTQPADCPGTDTDCHARTCTASSCGTSFTPSGTATATQTAGDCHKNACDGAGGVVSTVDPLDVPSDGNQCNAHLCTGGTPSTPPLAAGAACTQGGGKRCDGMGACVQCVQAADCAAASTCLAHQCVLLACMNGVKDGTETAVDCGGSTCPKCADLATCLADSDCVSGFCNASGICKTPTCFDGVQNHGETDTDCGGPNCPKCKDLQKCAMASDCKNGVCTGGLCQAATCIDGVQNGLETGVDCGGPACAICPTVLLLGSSTAGVLAGELHPGGSWLTSTLGDTSTFGPSLTMNSAGQGVGVITSQSSNEVHWALWSSGTWGSFQLITQGALAREQPFLDANGGAVTHLIYQDSSYHFFYLAYSSGWTPFSQAVGPGTTQSFGPVPGTIAALGLDSTAAFINGANPNLNFASARDRVGGAWQPRVDLAGGTSFNVTPSIIALGAGPELMETYVRSDTQLMFLTRTGGAWSAAAPITGCLTGDRVALAPLPGGGAILAFRGTDTNLYWSVYSAGVWSAVAPLTTPNVSVAAPPAVTHGIGGKTAELAFIEADGKAYHARLAGNLWSAPVQVGGVAGVSLAGVAIASSP